MAQKRKAVPKKDKRRRTVLDWYTSESWTAKDKQEHLVAGISIALLIGLLLHSWASGLAGAVCIGFIKEVTDAVDPKHHTSSMKDMLVTWLGGAIGASIAGIIIAVF